MLRRFCTFPCAIVLATLTVALVSGCGKNTTKQTFPVRGQVLVGKQPANGVLVIFTPWPDSAVADWPGGFPRGIVGEDGSFVLTTYQTDDGAPAGEYVVTFLWQCPVVGEREIEYDKLMGRYADPKTSSLRVQVKADPEGNRVGPFHLDE